jgi:hypothetical protein
MAKRSLFGNLFNENGAIQAVVDGMAIGLGGPDRRKEAMVESEKRRKEQMAAVAEGDRLSREHAKARAEAIKNIPPGEVSVDLPPIENDIAALLGMPQNTENMALPGENVARGQSSANAKPDSLFGGELAMALPTPPPEKTPIEQADDYLREMKSAPLSMGGQQKLIRLRQIRDRANSPDLLPQQQEELMNQFFQEQERLRVEDEIEQPPTIESESAMRVQQAPNGMQTIMQPDGRIDVKDPTTKAELKQIELQAKQQEFGIQQKTQISQMREQRRAEQMQVRQQEMAKQREVEAKVAEEKATRFKDHWSKSIEKVPMSARYEESRKELEAQYKSLNPKLPMRKFSPAEIRALAESKIAMDFMATERFADGPMSKPTVTPKDRIKKMAKESPEEFNQEIDILMDELSTRPEFAENPPTRADAIREMVKRTPESLESEIDEVLGGGSGWSGGDELPSIPAAPSSADMFVDGQDMQEPEGFLKGLFQKFQPPAQAERASEDSIESPSDMPLEAPALPDNPSIADLVRADAGLPPKPQAPKPEASKPEAAKESSPIQEAESLLADRIGEPVVFSDIVDDETIEYFKESGSKNPIEDAAKEITKALRTGAQNINLMSRMERDGAKRAFPMVAEDTDAALEKAGVRPGEIYRDGTGNLKEREVVKPKPKAKPKNPRVAARHS